MISVLAKMPMKEHKVDEAILAVKSLIKDVAKEEGTLSYSLNRDQKNPTTLIFIERYTDKEALKAHSASEHFKAFSAKVPEFVSGKVEITVMEELAAI
jgi:quinol monooxygenase YgiN